MFHITFFCHNEKENKKLLHELNFIFASIYISGVFGSEAILDLRLTLHPNKINHFCALLISDIRMAKLVIWLLMSAYVLCEEEACTQEDQVRI